MSSIVKVAKRIDLIRMLPDRAHVAEIGVRVGAFSNEILSYCTVERLYMIDPWKEYPDYKEPCSQEKHDYNYYDAVRMAWHHWGRAVVIRDFSTKVAESNPFITPLDAVYIDGNHSFEAVFADLKAWSKRLKPEGVLLGHDYVESTADNEFIQVIPAVIKFCKTNNWRLTHLTDEQYPSFRLQRK